MLKVTTVVMCKTCHGDKVHFLALQFEDVNKGTEGWMEDPPAELGRMCLGYYGVLVVYVHCNKSS